MSKANLFHDLSIADKFDRKAIVTIGSLAKWLSALAQRTVQIEGAESASENKGARFAAPGTDSMDPDIVWPPFEIRPAAGGFTIGYGTVNGIVPLIGAAPIDEEFPTEDTPRPVLAGIYNDIIVVQCHIRLTHVAIPFLGIPSSDWPPYTATLEFLEVPTVCWLRNSSSFPGEWQYPMIGTYNDSAFHVPLAQVVNGVPRRLRWGNISLSDIYLTNVTESTDS